MRPNEAIGPIADRQVVRAEGILGWIFFLGQVSLVTLMSGLSQEWSRQSIHSEDMLSFD